jgi:H+/Cl- antiporter ClcA
MFRLSITSTILRYYLMMLVVIIALYAQQMWLIGVAMAIVVSAILGYRIGGEPKKESKRVQMKAAPDQAQRKAS